MTTPASDTGRVAFIPLEANPELMTKLLHDLGLKSNLAIHDVYSLTEPELLAFIPRPAHALLLVFPVSAAYESSRLAEDVTLPEYSGKGDDEAVVWFKQTIRNACGMMGLLHAVSNGPARKSIGMYCAGKVENELFSFLSIKGRHTNLMTNPTNRVWLCS